MKSNRFISCLLGLLLLMPSCSEDFLDLKDPNRESSDTYWRAEDDYHLGLNACYSVFRIPGYFSRWFHVLMISRSDEGWSESPNPYFQAYSNFNIISYNDNGAEGIIWPWQAIFRQMFYCNQVIDNMNDYGMDLFEEKEEAQQILGQAYFIRGVAFWYVAGSFGKGPRMISSTANGEIIEQEDIYLQALSDFLEAEKYLPEKWTGEDLGRVTMGGAKGMIARIQMQLAGYYNRPSVDDQSKSQDYWQQAQTKIEEIFAMDMYSLVPNYKDNFTMEFENNSESLFEIQFGEGLHNGKELGAHRPKFFGLVVNGGAWADAYPRPWLLDEFRKEQTAAGEEDPRLAATLFYEKPGDTELLYGMTWSEWMATEDYTLTQPCYWRKYTRVETHSAEDYSSGINYRVIRLADVYLMYAEVLNELDGNRSMAVEYINKVRRRVGMSDLVPANFSTRESLHEQIMHERLVELCGESLRWYDLDRWGILHDQSSINVVASERDAEFNNFQLGISHLFPIPNRELSLYPGLTQNTGF
ncbi:MAG: RagB/SusD family nutrient uptake outer membrane protein [Bacteroidales bacterium]|nr:RagB/SusD family nutrient uptake outer membrane protein [Bacteroidales bacterium]